MPENQNTEYKQSWHDDYLKWVCGFANAMGGQVGGQEGGSISGAIGGAINILKDRKQEGLKLTYSNPKPPGGFELQIGLSSG